MLVSYQWLCEYVNLDAYSVDEIRQTLTHLGLEVESMTTFKPYQGQVVVAEIIEHAKMPDSDKLSVCKVKYGKDQTAQIVCGAANAKKGMKTALALPGAELPNGLKIAKGKIRNTPSEGMMCSDAELGFGTDASGIKELNAKAPIGADLAEYCKMIDTVFEIKLTPNRADCLGHFGIARDLAAKLGLELMIPEQKGKSTPSLKSDAKIKIEIKNPDLCPRFTALYVKGLEAKLSPTWLQNRLRAVGQRPINLIVDVTNYVMLEYSQPIHAYDLRDIKGQTILVKEAKNGDKFQTLDATERALRAEDITISDASGPIGLAGVMGGLNSEVKDDTHEVIIEVACFDPAQIRKTSKHFGLHTEASHRFERGVDIENIANVCLRTAFLLQKCSGEIDIKTVEIAPDIVDAYPHKFKSRSVALRVSRLKKILALPNIKADEIVKLLESLGLKLQDKKADDRLLFSIPSWRLDLEREIDLIEEVARLYGYNRIPSQTPYMDIEPGLENPLINFADNARESMARCGMVEVISYSFIANKDYEKLLIPKDHILNATLGLANPINEDMDTMQTTLAANMLKTVSNNKKRGLSSSRFFEIGRIYFNQTHSNFKKKQAEYWQKLITQKPFHLSPGATKEDRPIERQVIAGIVDYPLQPKSWNLPEVGTTFYHGKALVLEWLKSFGLGKNIHVSLLPKDMVPFLNPQSSAVVYENGVSLGYFGVVHPQVALNYDLSIDGCPVYFEMDLQSVMQLAQAPKEYDSVVSKFPPTLRDLSILVSSNIVHQNIIDAMESYPQKEYLKSFELFDIYTAAPIKKGFKSLTYSVAFQSPHKTLNDKEVDKELTALLEWLNRSVGAELRV